MSTERFQRLRDWFEELLALGGEARQARLQQISLVDSAAAYELARMLSAHSGGSSVLDRSPIEAIESSGIAPGTKFGAYKLERELGRGGMGVVYLASRADGSFDKRVAIKIVRHDRVDVLFLRRFQRERQILAQLNHPHIAAILDAGTSPAGDSFLVMEYVDGTPLMRYCETHALTLRQKLDLFLQVCDAVQHAHRNLTVHRDLKPGNILVTEAGAVKLLDFGIAKLLESNDSAETTQTIAILTPEYASPEQIRSEPISTAADIFCLGIVLYEMLSGKHPFANRGRLPHEVMRAIVEDDPVPVSEAAAKKLPGELDVIVATAIRKQPSWRYPSVEQLADDIQRYQSGRPVLAKGDSFFYRASKFTRRHWLPMVAMAAVILILASGIVITQREARAAERARRESEQQRAVAQQQRAIAEQNQRLADARTKEVEIERSREQQRYRDLRALASSLLFELHDGIRDLAGAATARRLIVTKARQELALLSAESGDDPEVKRDLAAAYERMGELRLDPQHPKESNAQSALDAYRRAVELRTAIAADGKRADRRDLALGIAKLGDGKFFAGDTRGALSSYDQAWRIARALFDSSPGDAGIRRALGTIDERRCTVLVTSGNTVGSIAACKEGIAALTAISDANRDDVETQHLIAATHGSYANALRLSGNSKEAAGEARAALQALDRLQALAPNNMEYRRLSASIGTILANILASSGDQQGSLEAFRNSVHAMEIALEIDPSDLNSPLRLAVTLLGFSRRLAKTGDQAAAHASAAEAMGLLERTVSRPGAGPVEWNEYADAALKVGFKDLAQPAKALQLAQQAVEATQRKNPFFLDTLAWAYYETGSPSTAAETERAALSLVPAEAKGGLHDELQRGLETFLEHEKF